MAFTDALKAIAGLPVAIGKAIAENPVGFVGNELLGVDDFRRFIKYADEGNFTKAMKSLGAGAFELGSTIIPAGKITKSAKAGELILPTTRPLMEKGFGAMIGRAPGVKRLVGKEVPVLSTRILAAIPGATSELAGLRSIRPGAVNALRGFRGLETLQNVDMLNALAAGTSMPAVPVGSARGISEDLRAAAKREALRKAIGLGDLTVPDPYAAIDTYGGYA